MTRLELDVTPEPEPPSPSMLAARRRRALVVGLGGGRDGESPMAKSSFVESGRRPEDAGAMRGGAARPASPGRAPTDRAVAPRPSPASDSRLQLDDALVVPAGALVRGYLRCRALLLVGDIVGNVHCTGGPVIVRSGARLKGRLVAAGDVYVCGSVGDGSGGAVITTTGKLTLAPGSRVDGDVRSACLDLYDGAMLRGVAKGCED